MFNLFPKDGVFYELFEEQAKKLSQASKLFNEALDDSKKLSQNSAQMKDLEKEADEIGHQLMENLRRNFITPLEGEDIDLLRQNMDNIMDFLEKAVNRMVIYHIPQPVPSEIHEYAHIIDRAVNEISDGIQEIKNVKKFNNELHARCKRINDLENEGDELNRQALGKLMNLSGVDCRQVMEIIKLKEIYETLENAIDSCEDVANMFESILIKNQ